MNVTDKLTKARLELILGHPFFGTLALRMSFKENPKVKNARTDGYVIEYNPDDIDKLPVSKVQGLLAGCVMHLAMQHHLRRGNRENARWNKACDAAINPILKEAGFDIPDTDFMQSLMSPEFENKSAEQIYPLLPEEPGKDNDGDGDGSGDGGGGSSPPDPNGGVDDSPDSQNKGASASQQRAAEAEWKQAFAQAAYVAKQAGKLPGSLERLLEEVCQAQIPWREVLRRFMTEKAADDFSWARPNRRLITQGIYIPSRLSEGSGTMVVVIDTSGSISDEMLQTFGGEIKGIVEDAKPTETHVIYCDAEVNHVDVFKPEDQLTFKMHGGGGTDFRPPFEYLEIRGILPKAFVYLTDGYGPFPEEEAPFPVLWAINNDSVTPPWGEHLTIEV